MTEQGEYLAECFLPGVSEGALAALDARVRAVESGEVRYLGSLLVPEDEVVLCFFQGPSAEAVRALAEQAEVPFARIVPALRGGAPSVPVRRERKD
ncbi:MAG TPA: nickel-binding protein [Gaiellaceae bacterium]|nr:nickel-binding protein [Gaiellaceae bacterium]